MDYPFFMTLHSLWRYVVLAMLGVSIVLLLVGWLTGGKWNKLVNGFSMFTPITITIQLVLGLVIWGWRGMGVPVTGRGESVIEHFVTMLLVVVLGFVAAGRIKRAPDDGAKFQQGAILFVLTGLVAAVGVARVTGVL